MTARLADRPGSAAGDDAGGLTIFRLVPTAPRTDRRFARNAFHGEVVVRASSAADARLAAAEAEAEALGRLPADGSPFADDGLYTVIQVSGAGFLSSGKRGLIAGRFLAKPRSG